MARIKRFHMTKKSAEAEIKRIQSLEYGWGDLRIYKTRSAKSKFWIGTYMEWLNR